MKYICKKHETTFNALNNCLNETINNNKSNNDNNDDIIPLEIINIISIYAIGDIKQCEHEKCNKDLLILECEKYLSLFNIHKNKYYCDQCYQEVSTKTRPETIIDKLLGMFDAGIYQAGGIGYI